MNTYMTNMFIDTIQNAKRSFVNTFVQVPEFSGPMLSFVDAQTAYTKAAVDNASKCATAFGTASKEAFEKATKGE